MGFRGGGQIDPPPQRILVFKYLSRDRVKMTKIYLQVFNISLKLFKALLVRKLQVQGGANMIKHQFGGDCNPPFQGKCRVSSFPAPLTRRTAAVDHYCKLMEK